MRMLGPKKECKVFIFKFKNPVNGKVLLQTGSRQVLPDAQVGNTTLISLPQNPAPLHKLPVGYVPVSLEGWTFQGFGAVFYIDAMHSATPGE